MRIFFFFILFNLFSNFVFAQKSVFYSFENNKYSNNLDFEITNLNFIKNNEYFNNITDGYTLLGTQIQPIIIYNRGQNIQFKTGFMAIKYFGENNIDVFIPLFSFKYKNKNHSFIFGNYTPRYNHGLIEPLMGNEKVLSSDLIETGLQYKYDSNLLNSDVWFNWENYIRPNYDESEKFVFGVSNEIKITDRLTTNIQGYYYHEGGQINKKFRDSLNIDFTLDHLVGAIGFKYKFLKSLKSDFSINSFYMQHSSNAIINKPKFPFKNGTAYYLYLNYKSKEINLLLGYYKSNKFISPKGNEIFQAFSQKSNVNYWNGVLDNRFDGLVEPNRSLIFSRLFYEKYLDNKIKIGLQLETYYQLNDSQELPYSFMKNQKGQFDYSYGIFMIFNDVFKF